MQQTAQGFSEKEIDGLRGTPTTGFSGNNRILYVNEKKKYDLIIVPPTIFSEQLSSKISQLLLELNSIPPPPLKRQCVISVMLFLVILVAMIILMVFVSMWFILLILIAFFLMAFAAAPDNYFRSYKARILQIVSSHSAMNSLVSRFVVRHFSLNNNGINFICTVEPLEVVPIAYPYPQGAINPIVPRISAEIDPYGFYNPNNQYRASPYPDSKMPEVGSQLPFTSPYPNLQGNDIPLNSSMADQNIYSPINQHIGVQRQMISVQVDQKIETSEKLKNDYKAFGVEEGDRKINEALDYTVNENDVTAEPFFQPPGSKS